MPNTTQVPNYIIDELLPRLKDAEFKVLIVIVRQTLGWIEDAETGRRKERDWISRRQMSLRTGMSERSISRSVSSLVDQKLIETLSEDGRTLETWNDRRLAGSRIYYRLATRNPSLFDKPTSDKMAQVKPEKGTSAKNDPRPSWHTTKETLITKENTMQSAKPIAPSSEKKEEENTSKTPKEYSPHRQFVDYWHRNVRKARGITPIITGQDGKNLQRILKLGIEPDTLEKAAIYFLHDRSFRKFSPSISTLLSGGIITGLMDRMRNEPDFWKKLDGYIGAQGGLAQDPKAIAHTADQFAMLKARLAASFKMPYQAPIEH
jgi:DNA-binding transcriptional ArsR family regulator